MTTLRATFYFEVDELCIRRELLGTTHELDYEGRRVRVTFPLNEGNKPDDRELDPSSFPDSEPLPLVEGAAELSSSGIVLSSENFARVFAVRVEVLFEGDVDAATYAEPAAADAHVRASEASMSALETAKHVVGRLIAWLRVTPGQAWLGLTGDERWPTGRSRLEDIDASLRLPYALSGSRYVLHGIGDELVVDSEAVETVVRLVEANEEPPLAESVLADAIWLRDRSSDMPRVVLTAAIACELKVKQVLRASAKPEAAELVDVLLESPRDFSMAAVALFHRPMKAIVGRSLRDDNRELWRRVDQLFRVRNDIAHRGRTPTPDEARDCLRAAVDAFGFGPSARPLFELTAALLAAAPTLGHGSPRLVLRLFERRLLDLVEKVLQTPSRRIVHSDSISGAGPVLDDVGAPFIEHTFHAARCCES